MFFVYIVEFSSINFKIVRYKLVHLVLFRIIEYNFSQFNLLVIFFDFYAFIFQNRRINVFVDIKLFKGSIVWVSFCFLQNKCHQESIFNIVYNSHSLYQILQMILFWDWVLIKSIVMISCRSKSNQARNTPFSIYHNMHFISPFFVSMSDKKL